jgi:putative colanic acid biosynthesis UDP-glucose lipid carrier transferase
MKNISKLQIVSPYTNKLLVFGRLLDAIVIGVTLWSIIDIFHQQWSPNHTWWLLITLVGFDIFAEFNERYRQKFDTSLSRESGRIIFSWLWAMLLLIIVNLAQVQTLIEASQVDAFWIWALVTPIELLSWHVAAISIILFIKRLGFKKQRVAIYGATQLGADLEKIFKEEDVDIDIVGFFDDRQVYAPGRDILEHIQLQGNLDALIQQAKEGTIDLVCIALPMRNEARIRDIILRLSDTTVSVYLLPDLVTFDLLSSSLRSIKGIPVISVHDTPFYGVDGVIKRLFDIFFGTLILLLIALPMFVIAVAVKFSSPGPVIFKQRRYGFKGEEIVVWKFRSMTTCDDGKVVQQAQKNDPRVTVLGAFLRKASLDELPQFFNVLQGRMSIVGPRPHAVAHNEFYRSQIQGYMLRHKVKPGITGLAQIKGFRGETDTLDKMEGRIRYDLEYIKNWSIWLDLKILLLTVFKGFIDSKAY